jgi:hypothetical protein
VTLVSAKLAGIAKLRGLPPKAKPANDVIAPGVYVLLIRDPFAVSLNTAESVSDLELAAFA